MELESIFMLILIGSAAEMAPISELELIYPTDNDSISVFDFVGISVAVNCRKAVQWNGTLHIFVNASNFDCRESKTIFVSNRWNHPLQIALQKGWSSFDACLLPFCKSALQPRTCPPPSSFTATISIELMGLYAFRNITFHSSTPKTCSHIDFHPEKASADRSHSAATSSSTSNASCTALNQNSFAVAGVGGGVGGGGSSVGGPDWARYDPATDAAHYAGETWSELPARWHGWWRRGSEAAGRHIFASAGDAAPSAPCHPLPPEVEDPEELDGPSGGERSGGGGGGGGWPPDLTFPAVLFGLTARRDRRRHAWRLARALGFRHVTMPRTTPAADIDVDALLAQACMTRK
jgi:hypothetical protein